VKTACPPKPRARKSIAAPAPIKAELLPFGQACWIGKNGALIPAPHGHASAACLIFEADGNEDEQSDAADFRNDYDQPWSSDSDDFNLRFALYQHMQARGSLRVTVERSGVCVDADGDEGFMDFSKAARVTLDILRFAHGLPVMINSRLALEAPTLPA